MMILLSKINNTKTFKLSSAFHNKSNSIYSLHKNCIIKRSLNNTLTKTNLFLTIRPNEDVLQREMMAYDSESIVLNSSTI